MSFTPAWLRDDADAIALLPRRYASAKARAEAAQRAAQRAVHPGVLRAMDAPTTEQAQALKTLGTTGTICVVTGQQAGLFGGPLYTIYKTAAAIVDAREITAETGIPCVPIFWLQNEDHDFEEIAQCTVQDQGGARVKLSVAAESHAPRSIAFQPFGDDIDAAMDRLEVALSPLRFGAATIALIRETYASGETADRCFRALIQALFGHHGLLILDPTHPKLAEAAKAVHRRAVDDARPIANALQAQSESMAAAGFKVQVHIRQDAPLSFVHPEGKSGPRYRVEPHPDGTNYRLCGDGAGATLSAAALEAALSAGNTSTSALLRPILQDHLLPTVAYVGGPGEIAYLAQLPPLYAHFGLPMPLIIPRARFRIGDGATERQLAALGLDADDLGKPWDMLLAQVSAQSSAGIDPEVLQTELLGPFESTLERALPDLESMDKGLLKATKKTQATVNAVVTRLMERVRRARTLGDTVMLERLERVRARLSPDGAPQERVYAWPHAAARYGIKAFTDAVLDATVPFDGELKDLQF